MKQIGVSILCLAFNHENYISDAIDGFLQQKTSFPIEIIINEDCSTDRTAEIIRQYAQKYPDVIKPIYHKENAYSQGININAEYMLPLASGKYIALCDGDDYWIDPLKLQKQYDAMESNPSCQMCLHRVKEINAVTREEKDLSIPIKRYASGLHTSRDFFYFIGQGEFFNEVSYFFRRKEYTFYQQNYPKFAQEFMKNKSDDVPMLLYFGQLGNVYYIDEPMAVYRRFVSGSWSENHGNTDLTRYIAFCENSIIAYKEFNVFSGDKYSDELERWQRYFEFKKAEAERDYKKMISGKYSDILKKQENRYQKRVYMQAKLGKPAAILFKIYDFARKNMSIKQYRNKRKENAEK